MGTSGCVRTLGRPVHPATWPGHGVGMSELLCLLCRPEVVFAVCAEVHLPVVERFLGRLVASGPPRLVGCFGRRVLWQTVVAFSTFSLVCVVVLVWRELVVHFWVSLALELESSSQSSISAMLGMLLLLIVLPV